MARLNTFRKGDKSEYLAQLFLSSLSFSNPIYRQEDYGIDFVCSIIDKQGDKLYPNETFNVQVKSGTNKKVEYTAGNDSRDFHWLFRNQTPIVLAHLNLDKQKMFFYCYPPLYYLNLEQIKFTKGDKIVLNYTTADTEKNVPRQLGYQFKEIKNQKKGEVLYAFELGNPFMTITMEDIKDDQKIENKKQMLKKVLKLERDNILYKNLHLPLLRWFLKYETNLVNTFQFGWVHFCTDEQEKEINKPNEIIIHLGQLLITLSESYRLHSNDKINGDKYLRNHNFLRKIIADLPLKRIILNEETYEYESFLKILKYRDNDGNLLPDIT